MGDFVANILGMVSKLLEFLKEFKAAGIVDIIMNWFGSLPF